MYKNYDLFMVKGDSMTISFKIMIDNEYYVPRQGDVLYFTVKPGFSQDKIIQKIYPDSGIDFNSNDNEFCILINPSDTDNIEAGTYKYDIEIVFKDDVNGVVKKTPILGNFIIKNEVTTSSDEV